MIIIIPASANEQINKEISNMGTKSSSIQITSTKLRMNSNEHESEQFMTRLSLITLPIWIVQTMQQLWFLHHQHLLKLQLKIQEAKKEN
jgi:hypothetical protein